MLQKKLTLTVVLILILSFSLAAETNQIQDSTRVIPQQLKLPENVQSVLVQEMTTITKLMGELLEYIVKGDGENASMTALEISDTNLKQKFNSKEIKEIMKILPKGFIKMDRKFHSSANKLAKAADTNDFKTALSIYNDMTQSCLNCHTAYVSDRFENLKK